MSRATLSGVAHSGSVARARVLDVGVVVALARRPDLWVTAVRQAWRIRPRRRITGGNSYLAFRLQTQYGGNADAVLAQDRTNDGAEDRAKDIVSYVEWCREWNSAVRRDRRVSLTRRRPESR